MKIFKRILLLIAVALIIIVFVNYPKLNILSGYAAKNTGSSVFLAGRTLEFTDANDNNFSPVSLATNSVNKEEQFATSSAFGLLTRKAIYREGLGAVLVTKDYNISEKPLVPNRAAANDTTAYPYGNAPQKRYCLCQCRL